MNPLIFWVEREIVFPITLYRSIPVQIVLKERLLYFNTIVPGELKVRLQEKKSQIEVI